MSEVEAALLDGPRALAHAQRLGLAPPDATWEALGGGVSNGIFRVGDVIVKQALPRLRVEREWLADPARTLAEGRALRLAAALAPGRVPAVLDLDEAANILVIEAAPVGTPNWKEELLAGRVDQGIAREMGEFAAAFHLGTRDEATMESFELWEAFEQLRVRPYLRTMVEDEPALAPLVLPVIEEMRARRTCLVHGDLSPKNVLAGPGLPWLIDFEVAHAGDPAFDIAFMLCHLAMKSLHLPEHADEFRGAALAFHQAYVQAGGPAPDDAHLTALLGLLLMARVRGRSPAEYLDARSRPLVYELGRRLASSPPATVGEAFRA